MREEDKYILDYLSVLFESSFGFYPEESESCEKKVWPVNLRNEVRWTIKDFSPSIDFYGDKCLRCLSITLKIEDLNLEGCALSLHIAETRNYLHNIGIILDLRSHVCEKIGLSFGNHNINNFHETSSWFQSRLVVCNSFYLSLLIISTLRKWLKKCQEKYGVSEKDFEYFLKLEENINKREMFEKSQIIRNNIEATSSEQAMKIPFVRSSKFLT